MVSELALFRYIRNKRAEAYLFYILMSTVVFPGVRRGLLAVGTSEANKSSEAFHGLDIHF